MDVAAIDTSDLGDRSYVVSDGDVAAVVDPQRDVDRVLREVEARGLRVTHVLETHIHNDYLTGGLELARRTGAEYVVRDADEVTFQRWPVAPGDRFEVGRLVVEALATPGHTQTHLAYAVRDGDEVAVFTGGSMLYGAVGRTDLLGPDLAEELAHRQYHSVRGLAEALPGATGVYPTHGFGSFCSSNRGAHASAGTIDDERGRNPALTTDDEDHFAEQLLAGYTAFPTYYRHMAPLNRSGPSAPDLDLPPLVDDAELARRMAAGEWVVDVRDRIEYAKAHRRGTVNVEGGPFFATYMGWVVPFGAPVTLLGDDDAVAEARRALARIGYDHVVGRAPALDGDGRDDDTGSYRVATFADLADEVERPGVVVLDVRREDEWRHGHLPEAVHVHLPELPDRLDEVPDGEVWVHCASGFRSALAASLLDRAGRRVVLVDDEWKDTS